MKIHSPRRRVLLAFALGLLAGCGPKAPQEPVVSVWRLLERAASAEWRSAEMDGGGVPLIESGVIMLPAGKPMTAMRFDAWAAQGLPIMDYAVSYEARRIAGSDFFGTITFPVGALDRCVSFVLGGWGGAVVGISSIDDADAGGNETRSEQRFDPGVWYKVRIEVRADDLRAWIDDRIVVNVSIKGRRLGMRAGEIRKCMPFGFASYATDGEVRSVRIESLKP